MSVLEDDLRRWIVIPGVTVKLCKVKENSKTVIGCESLKELLAKHLNETGRSVDGKNYDVIEETKGNVTVAFAVQYTKYFSDWSLIPIHPNRNMREAMKKGILPIGTCIEGIRVEFTTPGYKGPTILAIANVKNSKYQTNVARSAIEFDSNRELLSDIYSIFEKYIENQMAKLEQSDYSKSWAIYEAKYLMLPLLNNSREYSNIPTEPVDEDILVQQLASLKCIILESNGERRIVSATEVSQLEEVNIFDCKITKAAESLLRELKSSATLQDIIQVVHSGGNFLKGIPNLICNYDSMNILHQYALRNKEVSAIKINRKYLVYVFPLISPHLCGTNFN